MFVDAKLKIKTRLGILNNNQLSSSLEIFENLQRKHPLSSEFDEALKYVPISQMTSSK